MLKKTAKISSAVLFCLWLIFCLSVYVYPQGYFYNPSSQKANLANAHLNSFKAQEVKYNSFVTIIDEYSKTNSESLINLSHSFGPTLSNISSF